MDFDVEYFARLARLKLTEAEKRKFAKELREILGYVEELKEVDTADVTTMTGGTELRSVFREDVPDEKREIGGKGRTSFPDEGSGFLRVPKVFD
jgi:aspartyl-tRNA(Asn)/glutamyl-tRNA(Gln) amidotransferase subunit C